MVVTESDFDGLAWIAGPETAEHLGGLVVDGITLEPTRLSSLGPECDEEYTL